MNKYLAGICGLLVLTVSQAALAQTLRFGTDPTYPPYESKNADGSLVGLDIAIGNEICKTAGVTCVWVESGFDGLIPGLNAKKFDAIMSSMAPNAQRQKVIDFSQTLYEDDSRLISAKNAPLQPQPEALSGKNVGVLQGSVQAKYADAKWRSQGVNVTEYPDQQTIYGDLANGRLDATFVVATSGQSAFLDKPAGAAYAFSGEPVKDPMLSANSAIGVRKGDEQTLKLINDALIKLTQDGTIAKLEKEYLSKH
jgi:lysine/arginine/ornithine transport system substrate-binding protein